MIANVLKRSGIEPAPERGKRTQWSTFLKAHWRVLFAADFLTVEVWTARGLVTHYLLFVMSLADRLVAIAGITTQPDSKYTAQFRRLIRDSGTNVIRLPPRSPNLNAYSERFVRSIKDECLNRMIFIGQASLSRAVREYLEHYHHERTHQGLGNRLVLLPNAATAARGSVRRRARLGGVLNFCYREAAR